MLGAMADMQAHHNSQVHPQWPSQGYPYYRAIWVECAEMLDHYGWKWWKKQTPDLDQVKLELVDIWHFALSELMRAEQLDDAIALALGGVEPVAQSDPEAFREAIEALALACLQQRSFELAPFLQAMRTLPMDFAELYGLYVGKNVLNQFRQNNGYRSGEYVKLWAGREDNEHLVELLDALADDPAQLPERLYAALNERYTAST